MNLRQQNGVIGLEQEVVFQGLLGKERADEIFESDQSKFFFIKDLYLFQFAEHWWVLKFWNVWSYLLGALLFVYLNFHLFLFLYQPKVEIGTCPVLVD